MSLTFAQCRYEWSSKTESYWTFKGDYKGHQIKLKFTVVKGMQRGLDITKLVIVPKDEGPSDLHDYLKNEITKDLL